MMELWLLLALCGAATYLWRGPGVVISASIDPRGPLFTWVSCVAYAIIAGLVARMLVLPSGALADTSVIERTLGSGAALVAYFWLTRRNLFVGVLAGAVALCIVRIGT